MIQEIVIINGMMAMDIKWKMSENDNKSPKT